MANNPRTAPLGTSRALGEHAYALLANGSSPEQAVQRLCADGNPNATVVMSVRTAAEILVQDRDRRVRNDFTMSAALVVLGAVLTVFISAIASGSGRLVVSVGLFVVGIGYALRATTRRLGWRTEGDGRRGRELIMRFESSAELHLRALLEGRAERGRRRQFAIVVFLVLVFFVVLAMV